MNKYYALIETNDEIIEEIKITSSNFLDACKIACYEAEILKARVSLLVESDKHNHE